MSQYRIIAITEDVAENVRASLRSPQYGHPAHQELAAGFGPCRFCLRTFREGQEDRILFTYNTFSGTKLTPLPGPIFIHQANCIRYEGSEFPPDLNKLDLLLEGYNADGMVAALEHPAIGQAEDSICKMLSNENVIFIHIRNAKAGCFVARVERSIAA